MSTSDRFNTNSKDAIPYRTLTALRTRHEHLIQREKEESQSPAFLDEAMIFIQEGRVSGKLLDKDNERRAAQTWLDFWATKLERAGREPPDATLADFDLTIAPELPDELCPYRGLDSFRPQDRHLFYGRQRLIEFLVNRLKDEQRLLVVIGPSGSGKSSLVLAGLYPLLKDGELPGSQAWRYLTMVPGSDPLAGLARLLQTPGVDTTEWLTQQMARLQQNTSHLVQLAAEQGEQPLVLIVDQFEELFTLCTEGSAQQAFVDNLMSLVQAPTVKHIVVLTMRSDFESHITRLPSFQPFFERARVQVTPLGANELRDAIEKPAEQIGLKFEQGVVDPLLNDILGEPAALPLLQFTLLKLWEHRERNRVTLTAYQQLGGGRLALERSADEFYAQLIPEAQIAARRILLRMVRPGAGLEVTSSRIRRAALYHAGEANDRVDRVLDKLIQVRLVRLSKGETPADDQVEVAHEALVRNWPRLVGWLDEERINIRRRLRLREAADEWVRLEKDASVLWSGVQLDEALRFEDYDEQEEAFVQASITLRDHQVMEKAAQQEAALKQAQALAEEQRKRAEAQILANRQLRRIQSWLVAAMIGVLFFAVVAIVLGQRAQQQADIAERAEFKAQNEALKAKHNLSMFLVAKAESTGTEQSQRSLLLAAEAAALSTQRQGESIPRTVQVLQRILDQTGGEPFQSDENRMVADATLVTISPEQHWLAAGSGDGAVYLWDLTTERPLTAITITSQHTEEVTTMAFSSDGHWLATGSKDHTVQLTDMTATDLAVAVPLTEHSDDVTTLAFMPTNIVTNGSAWLATGSADRTVQLFDLGSRDSTVRSTAFATLSEEASISKVAFSPDGRWLATVTVSDTLRLWKVDPNNPAMDSQVLSREKDGLIAFSPNGKWLVAASNTSPNVQLYAMTNPDAPFLGGQLLGRGQGVYALAFDSDEQWLAVASDNGSVQVWDLDTVVSQLQLPQLPEQPPVVSPTGGQPSELSYPMLTETVPKLLSSHNGAMSALAFAPDGDWLATGGFDHSFQLWRMADLVAESGSSLDPWLELYGSDGVIETILWSDQKGQVFTYSSDGSIRLWEPLASPPALKELTTEELIALACARAGRDFSEEEKQQYFGDNQYVSTCSQINVQPR